MKRRARQQQSPEPKAAKRRRNRPEQEIQRALFQHVAVRATRGTLTWHTPLSGARNKTEAAILRGLGTVPGIPDILALKAGRLVAIELKVPGGRLSPAQRETIAALKAAGARVEIADSLDDALSHLERWGILRGRAQ